MMLSWESEGIGISELVSEGLSYRSGSGIFFYLFIALLTILYSIFMIIFGCQGLNIPAILVSFFLCVYVGGWKGGGWGGGGGTIS